MRPVRAWLALVAAVLVGVVSTVPAAAYADRVAVAQSVVVDGTGPGRVFAGIGGLPATSRLLRDYPQPQRSQLLDYLFKPNYGASLQVLKVQIGGDTYGGGNGAEPSHMRHPSVINCDRGYAWWLMKEAKARNPHIRLSALAFALPGWMGTLWSDGQITYLVEWLKCAKNTHNLVIDSIGGVNETQTSDAAYRPWYVKFKQALVAAGFGSVRLICCDHAEPYDANMWRVAQAAAADPKFAGVLDIMGVHSPIPCRFGGPCGVPAAAKGSGKELRISELATAGGRTDVDHVRDRAEQINRMYIDGRITGADIWPMTNGWYSDQPVSGALLSTNRPWSGWYSVKPVVWVIAHTTQFTQPGWRYINSASGDLNAGGSFVTLRAPTSAGTGNYSIIAETVSATQAQDVTFTVSGGLAIGSVQLWSTNLSATNEQDRFRHVGAITPADGRFTVTLQPDHLYTLSTTTGQGKGTATPPPHTPMALPYSADFSQAQFGRSPPLFNDTSGTFEVRNCRTGSPCLRQMLRQKTLWWGHEFTPATTVGDHAWTDYTVAADVRLVSTTEWIEVTARTQQPRPTANNTFVYPGYHLRLAATGQWTLTKWDTAGIITTLASGTRTIQPDAIQRLEMRLVGQQITATWNGTRLAAVTDPQYANGRVGILVSKWDDAEFSRLAVSPTSR